MTSTHLVIGPGLGQDAEDSSELSPLRQAVLGTEGVARIYPPANVPSKIVRAVGVAASSVRAAIEDFLPSADEDAVAHRSVAVAENDEGSSEIPDEKILDPASSEVTSISVRIGTTAQANVPQTVRAVAQVLRKIHGEHVAVTVDVVHI